LHRRDGPQRERRPGADAWELERKMPRSARAAPLLVGAADAFQHRGPYCTCGLLKLTLRPSVERPSGPRQSPAEAGAGTALATNALDALSCFVSGEVFLVRHHPTEDDKPICSWPMNTRSGGSALSDYCPINRALRREESQRSCGRQNVLSALGQPCSSMESRIPWTQIERCARACVDVPRAEPASSRSKAVDTDCKRGASISRECVAAVSEPSRPPGPTLAVVTAPACAPGILPRLHSFAV